MTVINNATLILKDKQGNEGVVKTLTDNDINKISNAITDVGQVVDPATHMPIEATTASVGVVQLATAQDIENGTAGKVVDAQELNNFAQTLPSVNGVTDVSSGDNSNQLVISRIGGSKTLTIDNVEHAATATKATQDSDGNQINTTYVKLSGDQTVAGVKTFTSSLVSVTPDASDNSTKVATTAFVKSQGYLTSHQSLNSCVKTSGNQTIAGVKTFTNGIITNSLVVNGYTITVE